MVQKGPHSTRAGDELYEGEIYLDSVRIPDETWSTQVLWALKHPHRVKAATTLQIPETCLKSKIREILVEGLIRPAVWQRNDDPSKSQLPTFGLFSIGQQVNRNDTELPEWAEKDLLDRASKRGKGQQPILIGGIQKGSEQHVSLKAGEQ